VKVLVLRVEVDDDRPTRDIFEDLADFMDAHVATDEEAVKVLAVEWGQWRKDYRPAPSRRG
jgi:hypothetical protein